METPIRPGQEGTPTCAVNSKLNFTIGVLAIAAALVIAYFAWSFLAG